jgi:hypothetical protein
VGVNRNGRSRLPVPGWIETMQAFAAIDDLVAALRDRDRRGFATQEDSEAFNAGVEKAAAILAALAEKFSVSW